MAPQVQTLDQILAGLLPAYQGQKNIYGQMMDQNRRDSSTKQEGLKAQQRQEFGDIEQRASNKGMLFSGFSPSEQARYTSTRFLPALAGLESETLGANNRLALALAGLDTDARTRAQSEMGRQQDQLFSWQSNQQRQAFEAEQARLNREAEDRRLAQELAVRRSQISSQAPQAPRQPGNEFLDFIGGQFKAAGGQGNRNISRQQQDQWANQWFLNQGIMEPAARQYFWDAFNQKYNRSADPRKDWRYKR